MHLHKPNMRWLVHSWSTFGAKMSHERFRHTRFTTARTWGKPPPSPLWYTLWLLMGPISKWLFVPELPSGSPEIAILGTLATLGPHNFASKPLMEMRSEVKLYPSSRVFLKYVARHLHARESGRFLTFSG